MKKRGIDSHKTEKHVSTLVYIPHDGKATRSFNISSPLTKLFILFIIFAIIISAFSIILSYFITENRKLNEAAVIMEREYKAQLLSSNMYISRQTCLLEERVEELNHLKETQGSLYSGINEIANRLEGFSTQYFSKLPSTTSEIINIDKADDFLEKIKEMNKVLNEFQDISKMSEGELLQFNELKESLAKFLEYVPSYWPTESRYISSPFGMRWHPILKVLKKHTGTDIGGKYGDEIYASASGKVIYAGSNGGYGYMVKIDHGKGLLSYYAHASKLLVKKGDTVKKGDIIAKVGSTGISTGPHLHFEIRIDNVPVDPMPFISGKED